MKHLFTKVLLNRLVRAAVRSYDLFHEFVVRG